MPVRPADAHGKSSFKLPWNHNMVGFTRNFFLKTQYVYCLKTSKDYFALHYRFCSNNFLICFKFALNCNQDYRIVLISKICPYLTVLRLRKPNCSFF